MGALDIQDFGAMPRINASHLSLLNCHLFQNGTFGKTDWNDHFGKSISLRK